MGKLLLCSMAITMVHLPHSPENNHCLRSTGIVWLWHAHPSFKKTNRGSSIFLQASWDLQDAPFFKLLVMVISWFSSRQSRPHGPTTPFLLVMIPTFLCWCYNTARWTRMICSLYRSRSNDQRVWNIKKTKSALGLDVCSNILFVHALLGCDTTSRIHGIGKSVALRLMHIFATKQQSLAAQLLLTMKL